MNLTRHLRRWGNSAGVRIPKKVIDAANWDRNQELDIHLYGNAVILLPTKHRTKPALDKIFKSVTSGKSRRRA